MDSENLLKRTNIFIITITKFCFLFDLKTFFHPYFILAVTVFCTPPPELRTSIKNGRKCLQDTSAFFFIFVYYALGL